MKKILLTDKFDDVILKLSEGNPGAVTTCLEIINAKDSDISQSIPIFLILDSMELYGSNLYMLWNDCCDRNIEKVLKVVDGYCHGKISNEDINQRIKNVGYGLSFDDLLGE